MDIFRSLRNQVKHDAPEESAQTMTGYGSSRPLTISELLDSQIQFHESKIADLKAAKEAISPEVEKALNALAKIS